ncbi:quinone-dependent dihydroorotate dehydrogenase [Kaistia dalseonensis]|uniref:Dihydroorotate dehydrogenase (quinone) n=1 Tax=Kaistia dalseonensis TaxID=410840 RepID=A0ABU0HDS4_9HYPH|nr:quinone-dependent dihydroorotate dehydrogenase [Kaistia dalseonensis]MCX5497818.1 quinone-dependent dihydroorotate dehydrogenase [Kaistia dalseonensis]MDQ0440462.1 dihydroorotate dehydrogenase [Kaistia dalseonensis]
MSAFGLLRPALFQIDPETAHGLSLKVLASGLGPHVRPDRDPRLARHLFGLDFPNPLGLAAGLDKNGEVADGVLALGFGFVEIGTVTPRPQAGNPKPRLFRLVADRAVINRLGFNNLGHEAARQRLAARAGKGGIIGVNIGANKDSADRIADYVAGIRAFSALASYLTVNVSSPNTPGLRDLQGKAALDELLGRVMEARDGEARRVPIIVKIAPDVDQPGLADIAEIVLARGIDGVIVTNTTISRPPLRDTNHAKETGGLSGRPLFRMSTNVLARFRKLVGPDLPLIGAGGVDSPETAFAKITAGADLVQLYSGMVYEGPGLPGAILAGLSRILDRRGLPSIADAVGIETEKWAAERV